MRLETRYIDIRKSILIIDRNFHIDFISTISIIYGNTNIYMGQLSWYCQTSHDDFIKWKHFPRYWPFVRGIYRSLVNSPHKGQWLRAFMFLWSVPWINDSVNNHEASDLRRYRAHYDVIVMSVQCHTDIAEYIIWWVLLSWSRERWDSPVYAYVSGQWPI